MSLILVLVATGCRDGAPATASRKPDPVPKVAAQVLVIQTSVEPQDSKFTHHVYISEDGKVRLGSEVDQWRLFDTKNQTVTFVDDVDRTQRTVKLADLESARTRLFDARLPRPFQSATFKAAGQQKLDRWDCSSFRVELGGYRRLLCMTAQTPVPASFFRLYVASEPISQTYAPILRTVHSSMSRLEGYPVLDRSEMTYDRKPYVAERRLMRVERRQVPASMFTIPENYTNSAVSKEPAK